MNQFWQFILAHQGVAGGAVAALFVAGVCTMPALFPKTAQEWWTWVRDALQTAVPAARAAHANPTKPETPAQPQK